MTRTQPHTVFERHATAHPTWARHVCVLALLTFLCMAMYGRALHHDFQFDDEPNITQNPNMRLTELSQDGLARAVWQPVAPNRILVSLSFALQYRASQFLGGAPEGETFAFVPWQFRLFNLLAHIACGFVVYLLFLKLLSLPRVEKHLQAHAWPLAFLTTLVWFCSPVQTQAVTYIVQRATSMAALFMVLSTLLYLKARTAPEEMSKYTRAAWFAGSGLAGLAAVFSKEYAVVLPLMLLAIEFLLIEPGSLDWLAGRVTGRGAVPDTATSERAKQSLRWMLLVVVLFSLINLSIVYWALGRKEWDIRAAETNLTNQSRLQRVTSFIDEHLIKSLFLGTIKRKQVPVTPRQRLLTEFRVLAMYQSLLVAPLPSRLSLDYDFVETTDLFTPGTYERPVHWLPLGVVLCVILATWLSPVRCRFRNFLLLIVGLTVLDLIAGSGFAPVWNRPWPIPAILWHASLLLFAATMAYRRPLLAFGILLFYIGQLVESTILWLEIVFEHRLYFSSIGFYLALVIVVHECLYPASEHQLGPRVARSDAPQEDQTEGEACTTD